MGYGVGGQLRATRGFSRICTDERLKADKGKSNGSGNGKSNGKGLFVVDVFALADGDDGDDELVVVDFGADAVVAYAVAPEALLISDEGFAASPWVG